MNYLIDAEKLSIFHDGEIHAIQKSDPRYNAIFDLLGESEWEQVEEILTAKADEVEDALISSKFSDFVRKDGKLYYEGFLIEGSLKTTIINLINQGFKNIDRFKLFVSRLKLNPSSSSVRELFDFMSYDQLPINEKGFLLAYKGVQNDFYSAHGNTETIVEKGIVDSQGKIFNGIGEEIRVNRNQVDDDRKQTCSFGLHVGSMDYAKGHASKLLLVEVDPADVVSVPQDYSCQKMRVCAYNVLQEIQEKVECVAVDTCEGSLPAEKQESNEDKVNSRILSYIEAKHKSGVEPTIKNIQGALKDFKETCLSISRRLIGLGIGFVKNENALSKSVVVKPKDLSFDTDEQDWEM